MPEPPAGPFAASRIAFVHRGLSRGFAWAAIAATALPLLALLVLTLLGVLSPLAEGLLTVGLPLGGVVSLALGAIAVFLRLDLFARPGRVLREGDALVLDIGRRVPFHDIRAGFVIPGQRGTRVELVRSGGDVISLHVDDVASAEGILRAARVDVENQRCRMQLADTSARIFVAVAVIVWTIYLSSSFLGPIVMAIFGESGMLSWLFLSVLAGLIGVKATSLPEVTIGTDGIAFRRGFRETFVRFEDLVELRPAGLGLLIRTRDGQERKIASIAGIGPDRFRALLLRIEEARAVRAAERAPAIELLDRRGRSPGTWRVALLDLARRGTTYRATGLSPDDLEAVLTSPDTSPERRLAAAVTLRATAHPTARERIRVAAGQCASERLRIALERAGDGAIDEALAEALAIEEAEARGARRAG